MPKFKPDDISTEIDAKCLPCSIETTTEPKKLDRRIIAKDGTVLCHCDGTRQKVVNCLTTSRKLMRMHEEDSKLDASNKDERIAAKTFHYLSGTCANVALRHLLDKFLSQ